MNHLEDDNSQIENRVNNALDSSIDDLHPDIRRKLNQARIKALQSQTAMPFFKKSTWKMAGAISFVLTLTFITMTGNQDIEQTKNTIVFEDSLTNEDISLLDNLEFALWIAEEVEIASL
jgi:hypothetical protein